MWIVHRGNGAEVFNSDEQTPALVERNLHSCMGRGGIFLMTIGTVFPIFY